METNTVLSRETLGKRHLSVHGFTLLELMIAVSLVAILATLAYPSFRTAIAKGDRAVGISKINSIALSLERYYTFNRSYTNNFELLSMASIATYTIQDKDALYDYHIITPKPFTPKFESASGQATNGQSYALYANPTTNNKDTWVLSQDELGLQIRFASSDKSTPIDGWP